MQVSIIIVNYNTKELLKNCLNSIIEQTKDIDYEIIVSDNGSTDGSLEMLEKEFPNVHVIANNANLGFGAANNRGLEKAKGKYIFYLNSDTIILNNSIKIFYDYFENNNENNSLGALGCNLIDKDGNITASYDNNFSFKKDLLRFIRDYIYLWYPKIKIINKKVIKKYVGPVEIIIGADLFMLNNNLAKFDEYFFLYHEETDLQYNNLIKNNLKRIIIDGPQIMHLEGGSNHNSNDKYSFITSFSRIHDRLSKVKYYKKNGTKFQAKILKFILLIIWKNKKIINQTKKYIPDLEAI